MLVQTLEVIKDERYFTTRKFLTGFKLDPILPIWDIDLSALW